MPKASVLPEPVGERAITSRPAMASPMTARWIAKGSVIPARTSVPVTARDTPSSANDSEDMHNSLAAQGPRRFGRRWLTRTARCGTQASCLAADGADRGTDASSSTARRGGAHGAALQAALAGVVAQGSAEGGGLDLGLELHDALAQACGLAVHRILEPLHERLQMRDPELERGDLVLALLGGTRAGGGFCGPAHATDLPDPGDQPFTLAHARRFPIA